MQAPCFFTLIVLFCAGSILIATMKTIPITMPDKLYTYLERAAKATEKSIDFYVCESVEEYMHDIKDAIVVQKYLANKPEKTYTLAEAKKILHVP